MKLVIDISEDIYKTLKTITNIVYGFRSGKTFVHTCLTAIRNGIPLPKGHGKLIDTNEITAFRELECNGHNVESLDEFTTIIEADNESEAADL